MNSLARIMPPRLSNSMNLLLQFGNKTQGFGYQTSLFACTIIVVGKKASADGSVLISHTDTGQDSRIFVVPAQTFKPGEKAAVYWGIQDADRPLHDDGIILSEKDENATPLSACETYPWA